MDPTQFAKKRRRKKRGKSQYCSYARHLVIPNKVPGAGGKRLVRHNGLRTQFRAGRKICRAFECFWPFDAVMEPLLDASLDSHVQSAIPYERYKCLRGFRRGCQVYTPQLNDEPILSFSFLFFPPPSNKFPLVIQGKDGGGISNALVCLR